MSAKELAVHLHLSILNRAEWWRTNQDDSHGINKAVYVAMAEVANSINEVLKSELAKEMDKA